MPKEPSIFEKSAKKHNLCLFVNKKKKRKKILSEILTWWWAHFLPPVQSFSYVFPFLFLFHHFARGFIC